MVTSNLHYASRTWVELLPRNMHGQRSPSIGNRNIHSNSLRCVGSVWLVFYKCKCEKIKCGQKKIFIKVRSCLFYPQAPIADGTLSLIRLIDYTNNSLIVQPTSWPSIFRCPNVRVAPQPYLELALQLIGPPTSQPNPILKNITINKIELFDREQIEYSNVSSNSFIIPPLNLQV